MERILSSFIRQERESHSVEEFVDTVKGLSHKTQEITLEVFTVSPSYIATFRLFLAKNCFTKFSASKHRQIWLQLHCSHPFTTS